MLQMLLADNSQEIRATVSPSADERSSGSTGGKAVGAGKEDGGTGGKAEGAGQEDGGGEVGAVRLPAPRRSSKIRRVAPPKRPAKVLLTSRQVAARPLAAFWMVRVLLIDYDFDRLRDTSRSPEKV